MQDSERAQTANEIADRIEVVADRIVAALDMKRSGRGLVEADNAGEQQPDLPVLAHVVADRQPVRVVKKRSFRAPVVGWRQLALVG